MKSIVLFRCCDAQTPVARLQARRRLADWIITTWLASGVSMAQAMAGLVIIGPSIFQMMVALSSMVVCLLTSVPAIISLPIVGELERELAARGALPAKYATVESRSDRYGGRMLLFFILMVAAMAVFH